MDAAARIYPHGRRELGDFDEVVKRCKGFFLACVLLVVLRVNVQVNEQRLAEQGAVCLPATLAETVKRYEYV
jgi:hypothetical protein